MLFFRIKLLWKDIQIGWIRFQRARIESSISIMEIKNLKTQLRRN